MDTQSATKPPVPSWPCVTPCEQESKSLLSFISPSAVGRCHDSSATNSRTSSFVRHDFHPTAVQTFMTCCDLSLVIQLKKKRLQSVFSQEGAQTTAGLCSLIHAACNIIIPGKKKKSRSRPMTSGEWEVVYAAILELYATAQGFADSLSPKC